MILFVLTYYKHKLLIIIYSICSHDLKYSALFHLPCVVAFPKAEHKHASALSVHRLFIPGTCGHQFQLWWMRDDGPESPGRAERRTDTRSTDQNRGDDEWWHVFEFMLIPRFSSESVAPTGPLAHQYTPPLDKSICPSLLTSVTVLLSCAYLNFKPCYVGILLDYLILFSRFSTYLSACEFGVNISNEDFVALIALGSRLQYICKHAKY